MWRPLIGPLGDCTQGDFREQKLLTERNPDRERRGRGSEAKMTIGFSWFLVFSLKRKHQKSERRTSITPRVEKKRKEKRYRTVSEPNGGGTLEHEQDYFLSLQVSATCLEKLAGRMRK